MIRTIGIFALLAVLLLFTACKKNNQPSGNGNNDGDHNGNGSGTITLPGTPEGNAETKVIGAGGGTFTTADGRLSIDFPQGALAGDSTITIQPISNHAPGAAGIAYRITPHNINFTKPVQLTFSYGDEYLSNTLPDFMAIAYQDAKGIWQAIGGGQNDTTAKKVTVNTTHFSDWSLIKTLEMSPNIAFVDPGGTITLEVTKRLKGKDLFVPLAGAPIYDSIAAEIKGWKVTGPGTISPNLNLAIYNAPSDIPEREPIAVTAELKTSPGQYFLVANIYIGGEGVTFRVDKGPWKRAISQKGVISATTTAGVVRAFSAVIAGDATAGDGVTFRWIGRPDDWKFMPWTQTFPQFQYSYPEGGNSIYYFQYSLPSGAPSPGGLHFFHANEWEGGSYSGTFNIPASGKLTVLPPGSKNPPPKPTNHNIEGYFKIKWTDA